MFCTKCGTPLRDEADFCHCCGEPVAVADAAFVDGFSAGQSSADQFRIIGDGFDVLAGPGESEVAGLDVMVDDFGQYAQAPVVHSGQPVTNAEVPAGYGESPVGCGESPAGYGATPAGYVDVPEDHFKKATVLGGAALPKKSKKPLIIVLVIVVLALVAGGIALAVKHDQEVKEQEAAAALVEDQRLHSLHPVKVELVISGYDDKTCTRIPVDVSGKDVDGKDVSETQFINAAGEGLKLMAGTYTLTFPATPLSESGLTWRMPKDSISLEIADNLENAASVDLGAVCEFPDSVMSSVKDTKIATAVEYAKRDPEGRSDIDDLGKTTTSVRDRAVKLKDVKQKYEDEKTRFSKDSRTGGTTMQMTQAADEHLTNLKSIAADVKNLLKTGASKSEAKEIESAFSQMEKDAVAAGEKAREELKGGSLSSLYYLTGVAQVYEQYIETNLK